MKQKSPNPPYVLNAIGATFTAPLGEGSARGAEFGGTARKGMRGTVEKTAIATKEPATINDPRI